MGDSLGAHSLGWRGGVGVVWAWLTGQRGGQAISERDDLPCNLHGVVWSTPVEPVAVSALNMLVTEEKHNKEREW